MSDFADGFPGQSSLRLGIEHLIEISRDPTAYRGYRSRLLGEQPSVTKLATFVRSYKEWSGVDGSTSKAFSFGEGAVLGALLAKNLFTPGIEQNIEGACKQFAARLEVDPRATALEQARRKCRLLQTLGSDGLSLAAGFSDRLDTVVEQIHPRFTNQPAVREACGIALWITDFADATYSMQQTLETFDALDVAAEVALLTPPPTN